MTAIWSFPTRIVFGAGVSSRAGEEAQALGLKRVLIVSDAGVERAGLTGGVRSALEKAGIAVATYTDVDGNPTEENIEGGARAYTEQRADGVIAIGGGSPMDAGKLIALRAVCALPFEELDDAIDGGRHVPANVPPIIQIPTTAGTGSEVGRSGVLTVRSTQRKTIVFSPRLLARVALLDPELTRSMPPQVTAATGFDALTHCIEAYLSKGDHPMADAIALSGIEIASQFLERAVKNGGDMEARGMMMKAAMMGAVAFQKGLGACHSLAHPLSSEHGLHHGLANALCLPSVLRFNATAVPDRVSRVSILLGGAAAPLACATAVSDLRARVGLPSGLSAVGIQSSHLAALADKAFADACHQCNPRDCTRADLLTLYEASL
ncbi:MAG TPA: iron-containing alcohol dehydrogenase [Polyangiaceae bacterium]|jgi:alcohol dehydrogenase class IV